MDLKVIKGDITRIECDAIVNPANSFGTMGGGVALAIRDKEGLIIERDAMGKSPIPVGSAVHTTAGKLRCRFVIHSPTMRMPSEKIGVENVRIATVAALRCAAEIGADSIAFPGMGCGVGGVPKKDAAKAMVDEIHMFAGNKPKTIFLVGYDDELTKYFKKCLNQNPATL